MSKRGSNVERNRWLIELLAPAATDRVLELGPGPGVAMELVARRVTEGELVAVDHSTVMLGQTARRNRQAVAEGRLTLIEADAQRLPDRLGTFDAIYAMNVWQFWSDQETVVAKLVQRLKPGGQLALGYQPRHPGATDADVDAGRRCMIDQFGAAGLTDVVDRVRDFAPGATVVIGVKPAHPSARAELIDDS